MVHSVNDAVFKFFLIVTDRQIWYGDGADNTTEENSSVFSLIRCLQCFGTVGWAA